MAALLEPTWQDKAACRGPQAAVFYPPPRSEPRLEKLDREKRAKAICGQCTVTDECLDHALDVGEHHGIWGGHTENERRSILIARGVL